MESRGKAKEEGKQKKKLYVFFSHENSSKYIHTLFALDLPSTDGAVTTAGPSVTQGQPEPDRKQVEPVLRFSGQEWPRTMTCALIDEKLYFAGGIFGTNEENVCYPVLVHYLDLSKAVSLERYRDKPRDVMTPGPSMHSGKISPMISFAVDGKLFVLSGCKTCSYTGKRRDQFEYLDGNEWKFGKDPPFHDLNDLRHLIVNNKVFIVGSNAKSTFICSYDVNSDHWSTFDTNEHWSFYFEKGSQFIDDIVYTMGFHTKTGLPIVVPLNKNWLPSEEKKKETLEDEESNYKFFEVVPYRIPARRISNTLTQIGTNILCYLEVGVPRPTSGDPDDFNPEKCCMSATMFSVSGDSARYLKSAHYFVGPVSSSYYQIVDAFPV